MGKVILNQQYNAGTGDSYRLDGALEVQGIATFGDPNVDGLLSMKIVTGTSAAFSGDPVTISSVFPAGSFVIGATIYVSTAITASAGTTMVIGDGTDVDRWGTGIAFTAGTATTSASWTAGPAFTATALGIVFDAASSGSFTAGVVRYTAYYYTFGAPPKP